MKTLKLDHSLAEMVRRGEKTSTWRLYDDKDIRVNDHIELIDKVDPKNPDTWSKIGEATVDLIIEKRISDVTQTDYAGHGNFRSGEQLLREFQVYYGSQVTPQTPIKMIHFSLHGFADSDVVSTMPKLDEAKMYADGGSRGNPGPSASGYAIMDMSGQIVVKKGIYLGVTTNNQAEYQALRLGMEEAKVMHIQELHVYMDSLLVVNQMLGRFKVKNRDLWPIHEAIKELSKAFKRVTYTHVPRELNKIADAEVNEALDAAAQLQ